MGLANNAQQGAGAQQVAGAQEGAGAQQGGGAQQEMAGAHLGAFAALQAAADQQVAFAQQVAAAQQEAAALAGVQPGAAQLDNNGQVLVPLVPGAKGVPKACHDGYTYVRHKRLADGVTWRYQCENCNVPKKDGDAPKCYACIHVRPVPHNETVGQCVYVSPKEHNHEANAAKQFHLLVSRF